VSRPGLSAGSTAGRRFWHDRAADSDPPSCEGTNRARSQSRRSSRPQLLLFAALATGVLCRGVI
jgi:hypothetical protein